MMRAKFTKNEIKNKRKNLSLKFAGKNFNFLYLQTVKMVVVAQLVRALVCGAGSRGFESHHPPLILKEVVSFTDDLFFLFLIH